MKRIKHIWRYLTDPGYRFWINQFNYEAFIEEQFRMREEMERLSLIGILYPGLKSKE